MVEFVRLDLGGIQIEHCGLLLLTCLHNEVELQLCHCTDMPKLEEIQYLLSGS